MCVLNKKNYIMEYYHNTIMLNRSKDKEMLSSSFFKLVFYIELSLVLEG